MKGSLLDPVGRIIPECLLSLIVEDVLELGLYMQSACLIIKRLRAGCIARVPACRGRLIKILSYRAPRVLDLSRCSFFFPVIL